MSSETLLTVFTLSSVTCQLWYPRILQLLAVWSVSTVTRYLYTCELGNLYQCYMWALRPVTIITSDGWLLDLLPFSPAFSWSCWRFAFLIGNLFIGFTFPVVGRGGAARGAEEWEEGGGGRVLEGGRRWGESRSLGKGEVGIGVFFKKEKLGAKRTMFHAAVIVVIKYLCWYFT
jgi:hypothetical protein